MFHCFQSDTVGQSGIWKQADYGIYIAELQSSQQSITDVSKITVIKIDPKVYTFKLLCASELGHDNLTAKQWCRKYNLLGCINAGMFQVDHKTNVGYMKNFNYMNNKSIHPKHFSVAAFNPVDSTGKPFHIYDTDDFPMSDIITQYNTVIQNLRLIKNPAKNKWSQQNKMWSEAALGQDQAGNVLFIFSRSPYTMHDFNNILINLPLDIVNAQHLEGGPEASLYFSFNGFTVEKVGSYETGFMENNNIQYFWPVPNVIGFVKKNSE